MLWENIKVMLEFSLLQANLGNMDKKSEQWKMIGGNMALIQVIITLSKFSRWRDCFFFLVFSRIKAYHFMQIVSLENWVWHFILLVVISFETLKICSFTCIQTCTIINVPGSGSNLVAYTGHFIVQLFLMRKSGKLSVRYHFDSRLPVLWLMKLK